MTKKLILTISFIVLSALILVSCSNKAKTPMPISESSTSSSVESQSENEGTTNMKLQRKNLFLKKMNRSRLTRQKVIIRILQPHQKRTLIKLKKKHLQRQMPSRYSQVLQQLSRQGKKLQPKKLLLPQSRQPQRNILLLKNLLM